MKILISSLLLLSSFVAIIPNVAYAAGCDSSAPQENETCTNVDNLGNPFEAAQTSEELLMFGCLPAAHTVEDNWGTNQYFVSARKNLFYVEPRDSVGAKREDSVYFFCPQSVVENQLVDRSTMVTGWQASIIWVINKIIIIVGVSLLWILEWSAAAMVRVLSMNTYMNHQFVQSGWPFIQGIANLGFILALLFIAAATTLRLDIGGGVKRLLPRLLIAALLINFSLVIGALIIDASRLVMAIEINILTGGGGALADFGKRLIATSGLANSISLGSDPGNYSWSIPADLARKVLLIGAVTIGMAYAAVLLVVRHIALILLLLFSPLAYLAFAIPKADGLAKKWWSEFLKWALYGPILLFFLLLIVFVGTGFKYEEIGPDGKSQPIPFTESAINVGITAAMLIVAAKAGTMLAGAGGSAAIGMATKGGKKAAQTIARNPGKSALAIGLATGAPGVAAVGGGALAAKYAGRGAYHTGKGAYNLTKDPIKNQARDFTKSAKKGIANRWNESGIVKSAPILKTGTRDEKGNLKPGESSLGQRVGQRLDPKIQRANVNTQSHVNSIKQNYNDPNKVAQIDLTALGSRSAAQELTEDESSKLVINSLNGGHDEHALAAVNNKEIVRKIKDNSASTTAIYKSRNTELIRKFNTMKARIEDEENT